MTTSLRVAAALLVSASIGLGCARGTDASLGVDDAAGDGPDLAQLVARVPPNAASAGEPPAAPDAPAPAAEPWVDPPACSAATQFVYVLSAEGEIHRFSPPTLSFERVGRPACLPDGVGMFSMAVDRHARAFVLALDQRVYEVDLATGACRPTVVDRSAPGVGFDHFGMAYVADAAAPGGESLFVREAWLDAGDDGVVLGGADPGGRRLATLDPHTGRVELRGEGVGVDADLTGTGDGGLYGFFVDGTVAAIDTATGALGARWGLGLEVSGGWALAAWGGDLWVFSADPGETARARRFRPSLGSFDLASGQAGFQIVGAGVSTCAPTGEGGGGAPSPIEPPS